MRHSRCSGGQGAVATLGTVILGLMSTGLATAQPAPPPPGVEPSPDRHEITRRVRGEGHPGTAQGSNNLAESQPAQRTLTGTDAQRAQALEKQV